MGFKSFFSRRFSCAFPRAGLCLVLLSALLITACAETQLVVHATKKLQYKVEKKTGVYKVGNPYEVNDVWYYPSVDYEYDETGIASWYGEQFHGALTANGETFDMNAISAAHKTLPMPSVVQVTNLENGRSLKLVVNDRGPFVNGRILDASRRTAQLLGFEKQGTARVRVQILAEESRLIAYQSSPKELREEEKIKVTAVERGVVTSQSLAPPPGEQGSTPETIIDETAPALRSALPEMGETETLSAIEEKPSDPVITQKYVRPTSLYIQAGAFTKVENAYRIKTQIAQISPAQITEAKVGAQTYFRVRIGPFRTVEQADSILDSIINAGYKNARLIVE